MQLCCVSHGATARPRSLGLVGQELLVRYEPSEACIVGVHNVVEVVIVNPETMEWAGEEEYLGKKQQVYNEFPAYLSQTLVEIRM